MFKYNSNICICRVAIVKKSCKFGVIVLVLLRFSSLRGVIMNKLKSFLITAALTTLIIGCHEGPAEKKGKGIDNAVKSVQEKINPKGPAQKVGEKIDEATGK